MCFDYHDSYLKSTMKIKDGNLSTLRKMYASIEEQEKFFFIVTYIYTLSMNCSGDLTHTVVGIKLILTVK